MLIKEQKGARPFFQVESFDDVIDVLASIQIYMRNFTEQPYEKFLGAAMSALFTFVISAEVTDDILKERGKEFADELVKEPDRWFKELCCSERADEKKIKVMLAIVENLVVERANPLNKLFDKTKDKEKLLSALCSSRERRIGFLVAEELKLAPKEDLADCESYLSKKKVSLYKFDEKTWAVGKDFGEEKK